MNIRPHDYKLLLELDKELKAMAKKEPILLHIRDNDYVVRFCKVNGNKKRTCNAFALKAHNPYKIVQKKDETKVGRYSIAQWEVAENTGWDSVGFKFDLIPLLQNNAHVSQWKKFEYVKEVEVEWKKFDKDAYANSCREKISADVEARNKENFDKYTAFVKAENEFYAKRPKTIEAPHINAGSSVPFNRIGLPEDFVAWYSGTMFSAAMCDSNSIMYREEALCESTASDIIKEMGWTREQMKEAMEVFYNDHIKEGGFATYSDRELDKWF